MDVTTILVGIGIFVVVVLVGAVVVSIVVMRPVLSAAWNEAEKLVNAREVYLSMYEFTTSTSAQQIIDSIEQRYARVIPESESGYYVEKVIYQQQVILAFGNRQTPRIFTAQIDFNRETPPRACCGFTTPRISQGQRRLTCYARNLLGSSTSYLLARFCKSARTV